MERHIRDERWHPLAFTLGIFVGTYVSVYPEEVIAAWEKVTAGVHDVVGTLFPTIESEQQGRPKS